MNSQWWIFHQALNLHAVSSFVPINEGVSIAPPIKVHGVT